MTVHLKAIPAQAQSSECAAAPVAFAVTPLTTALAAVKPLMGLAQLKLATQSLLWESVVLIGAIRLALVVCLDLVAAPVVTVEVLTSTVRLGTAIRCSVHVMELARVRRRWCQVLQR